MIKSHAWIRGTNPYSFRPDEWALIIGVKVSTPEGLKPRAGFEVVYSDGFTDDIAISDTDNYEIAAMPEKGGEE